jgi:hypothetical protein
VERLCEQLKQETGVALSIGQLRLHLQTRGDVWSRLKHVLKGEVAEFLDELKNSPLAETSSVSLPP